MPSFQKTYAIYVISLIASAQRAATLFAENRGALSQRDPHEIRGHTLKPACPAQLKPVS